MPEAFTTGQVVPRIYVSRADVDDLFSVALRTNKVILIHGGYGQGKTALYKKRIPSGDALTISCASSPAWDLSDLSSALIRKAGPSVTRQTTTRERGAAVGASKTSIGSTRRVETERSQPVDPDVMDANAVIRALDDSAFGSEASTFKPIVLDDFGRLPSPTQRGFASQLRTFVEQSRYTFVIVGTWLEAYRLVRFSPAMNGRVVEINVDHWGDDDLARVIEEGERLLRVSFPPRLRDRIIAASCHNVSLLQQSCKTLSSDAPVTRHIEGRASSNSFSEEADPYEVVKNNVRPRFNQYEEFVRGFGTNLMAEHADFSKYILLPLIRSVPEQVDALRLGLPRGEIHDIVRRHYQPTEDFRPERLDEALHDLERIQVVSPESTVILDYDHLADHLYVLDAGFLVWLRSRRQLDLLELAGLRSFTTEEVELLLSVRETVEGVAAASLAKRRDPSRLADLTRLLEDMRDAARREDFEGLLSSDCQFHSQIAENSGLTGAADILRVFRPQISYVAGVALAESGSFGGVAAEHDEIFRAIQDGRPEQAAEEVRSHIARTRTRLSGLGLRLSKDRDVSREV